MNVRPALAAIVLLGTAGAASAAVLSWATAFGPEANGATGSGSAQISFDDATNRLSYRGSFSGLSGLTTQAHFHCCTVAPNAGTAGIAIDAPTLPGFPLNVSSGNFDTALDLSDASSFNPAFVTASGGTAAMATARLLAGFNAQQGYLNIHSTTFNGGEIRGFLQAVPAAVPEPGSLALGALALAAAATVRRRGAAARAEGPNAV